MAMALDELAFWDEAVGEYLAAEHQAIEKAKHG